LSRRQNPLFAFGYNALGIPLAARVLYPLTGSVLSPLVAAVEALYPAAALCSVRAALQTSRAAPRFIAAIPSPTSKSGQAECV